MYVNTEWIDEVKDGDDVIVEGTNINAQHLNNAEFGITDGHLAAQILTQHMLQQEDADNDRFTDIEADIEAEYGSKTMTNTDSYPFNNSQTTVALQKTRNLHYTVEAVVTGYTGGLPGNIIISDKAINGFKMAFDGSATSVSVDYIVKGGLLS